MPKRIAVLLAALLSSTVAPQSLAGSYPLFDGDDTLNLVLEIPMKDLLRRAKKKPVLQGQLRYVDADGREFAIDIDITTRGKSRLAHCSFPPLSITLNRDQTRSTLFVGQHKLKIGTHCNKGSTYLNYLEQEFGIYKAYNALSEYSFRVRKLNLTYRDSKKKRKDEVHPAFFIESDDEVAARLDMAVVRTPEIRVEQLDAVQTSIYTLFQYLVANTDWSIKKGPADEDCCHNGKVIGGRGTQDKLVVLPYDFDQAGLINARYALPARGLGIKSVRSRLYRGRCAYNDQLEATITLFNERRKQIEAALLPESLSAISRRSALAYIDVFYSTINDPAKRNREIVGDCLRGG